MENPGRISVIVPVYNVENYLKRCLDSIIGQSYDNLEILLVNDGSSDRSGEICEQYSKIDKRIRVFHQSNKGLSEARNLALNYASGDYVACVDSDDYIEKDMCETMLKLMDDETDIACCGTNVIFPDDLNKRNYVSYKVHNYTKYNNHEAVRELFFQRIISFSSCDKLFRRYLFEGVRYPKGKVCEDLPVIYEVISKSKNVIHIGKAKYNYVYRADSISRKPFFYGKIYFAIFSRDIVENMKIKYPDLKREAEAWYVSNIVSVLENIIESPSRDNFKALEYRLRKIIQKRIILILQNPYILKERKQYYIHIAGDDSLFLNGILKLLAIGRRKWNPS